ncbi:hypothetical protein GSH06_32170 [Burkholderia pseudomallei]|nr:hypothetical protein [Burkholderia pseudomallei]
MAIRLPSPGVGAVVVPPSRCHGGGVAAVWRVRSCASAMPRGFVRFGRFRARRCPRVRRGPAALPFDRANQVDWAGVDRIRRTGRLARAASLARMARTA